METRKEGQDKRGKDKGSWRRQKRENGDRTAETGQNMSERKWTEKKMERNWSLRCRSVDQMDRPFI